jgi:hypothetical protein
MVYFTLLILTISRQYHIMSVLVEYTFTIFFLML